MNLRTKLLLAQAPLVAALTVSGIAGSLITNALGRGAQDILKDNYRSVLAAERMNDNLQQLDRGALQLLAGNAVLGREQTTLFQQRFEQELDAQEGNITESGEAAATRGLRAHWRRYTEQLQRITAEPDAQRARGGYLDTLMPAFARVKQAADTILSLNQDAMVRKSERAAKLALQLNRWLVSVAALGCLLGLWGSVVLTVRLLRPLSLLSLASRRIGEGDLEVRAVVIGKDEIAELAREFNLMAERLKAYRESSLGELLEAQQSSQAAIDSLPDPVLVLTVDRQLIHLNAAAESLLKIELAGNQDPIARLEPALRAVIESTHEQVLRGKGRAEPQRLDDAVRVATPDGDRSFLPRAAAVYSEQGDVIGSTVVLQDVTRQLRVDELKNDLVATVAHEFRTPLTSMRMALHLLTEQRVGELSDKQAELLFAARDDCERLQAIVDELLDLSRIQAGRLQLQRTALDVDGLVRTAIDAQRAPAAQRNIQLQSQVFPGLGLVDADLDRVQRVFSNLLGNAIHHSPEGGRIAIGARRVDNRIEFEIADQGPGIPREYQQAIFDKHFQMPGQRGAGYGLGLFIVREIVHAHGGEVGVRSEVDRGSSFWFSLPVAVENRGSA